VSSTLESCLIESNFGKPIKSVKIIEIGVRKKFFGYLDGSPDLNDIELYGHAVTAAREIKKTNWFLTDENYLVCGVHNDSLPVIEVEISIDDSVSQLASPLFYRRIKPGWGLKVEVETISQGLHKNERTICKFVSSSI